MTPPRLAVRLLERWLPAEIAEPLIGDLAEAFEERSRAGSAGRSRAWFWRETLLLLVRMGLFAVITVVIVLGALVWR